MRARARRAAFAFLPLPSAKVKSSAALRSRALIRPSGTFSRKREKGCSPTRAALLPRYACPPSQPAAAAAPAPVPATSHKPQATATMPTPADRRALTAALPPLPEADARVIEAFIDAIWAESGLAQQSLDSYRRDLEGYARWRDGAQGGLAGADRAGLFEYLAWRTRHGWSPRSHARLLSALRAFFGHRVRQGQRKGDHTEIGRAACRGRVGHVLWNSGVGSE